ncbi:MAG: hypothetical protein M3077_04955 [Candidatus Dormibacteraeota bacterium]|nr:hypothetical protein [Candidatus Dormibacteraeota bacterium]
MAISTVQQGVITEAEFVKIVILGTNGLLVPERPLADDERRDFDIRLRRHFLEYLGLQIKTSRTLRRHGRARVLQINFRRKPPMDSNPNYWYFLGHFDVKAMTYSDPVFLVPSAFLHKYARHGKRRGAVQFQFKASMEPTSRDRWAQFRLTRAELGPRILELLEAHRASGSSTGATELFDAAGILWVGTRKAA